jgi:outer membrane lipoprotein-sorting protein
MTRLIVASCLLAACAGPQQPNPPPGSAEQTFKKIEDIVSKAKSTRVQYVWEGASTADQGGKVEATGTVLIKEGNRTSLTATIIEHDHSSELKIVSDGNTVKTRLGPRRILECVVPRNLEEGLKLALHRLGAMQAVLIAHKVCMLDEEEQEEALKLGKKPPISDFREGPDDGESKTILYKITPEGSESPAEVKLWYAPKNLRLVKRTITIKKPSESIFTEVYKEWTLDPELENEEFKLPSVK